MGCGLFTITIYATAAGTYAVWLEWSDTDGVWGPPTVPLEVIVQ